MSMLLVLKIKIKIKCKIKVKGLLYGFINGYDLNVCGKVAARAASSIITKTGADLTSEDIENCLSIFNEMNDHEREGCHLIK